MADFKDHFSRQAALYAQFRPQYPRELFAFLATLTTDHNTAWDCGTGNGQAAQGLTEYYQRVIATDPSEAQLKNRREHARIQYIKATAEHSGLPAFSVDLLTVANAVHWFNFDLFYKEVHRIVKPGGAVAVWTVSLPSVNKEADKIIAYYHNELLDPFWLPENRMVERGYADLPFPFEKIPVPAFYSEKLMTTDDMIGYLKTWSATQTFIRDNGYDPTLQLKADLQKIWGARETLLPVRFDIILLAGRI